MKKGANGLPDPSNLSMFANLGIYPVDMKVGPNGDLFFVDIAFGAIRQITYTGDENRAPTAHAVASPAYGPAPLEVGFDASGSTDPDEGDTLTYAWDLDGDGEYDDSTEEFPRTTYDEGTHNVSLRVTDSHGASHDDDLRIDSGETPPERLDRHADAPALNWHVGQNVSFSGSATDEQDGPLPASALSWNLIINHCITVNNCHAHPVQDYDGVASGSFVAPDHGYPSHLLLQVTATDSRGLTDSKTVRLDPQTVNITVNSSPANLNMGVDEKSGPAPLVHEAIVGRHHHDLGRVAAAGRLDLLRVRRVVGRQGPEPRDHGSGDRHHLHGQLRPAHEADLHAGRRCPCRGGDSQHGLRDAEQAPHRRRRGSGHPELPAVRGGRCDRRDGRLQPS